MLDLVCKQCWKNFKAYWDRKYCSRECYSLSMVKYDDRECLQCGKIFHPQYDWQLYCSHKCLWLSQRKREESICPECWKAFYSRNNKYQIYCSKECYTKSQTFLDWMICKTCWKEFKGRGKDSKFCSRKCRLEYMHNEPIEEKMARMKILWESNPTIVSKVNLRYKEYLEKLWFKVGLEFQIKDKFYDLKVWDTLIEINPTYTHNSTYAPKFNPDAKAKDRNYHIDKLKLARDNWYRCIMVRDRDDFDKITYLLDDNKKVIYARNCEVKEISRKDCHDFFETYHLQWDTRSSKNNIYVWLYYEDTLVECMSFGKPRYNKNYEREILRLCSHKDFRVVWWANRIFNYFLDLTQANSVISYCDMSKFDWRVYEQLWFSLAKWNQPSKHRYNDEELLSMKHITDNLLRQRWYDQLFDESHGKWTDNEELMLQRGYVEIYDCWQATFIRNK